MDTGPPTTSAERELPTPQRGPPFRARLNPIARMLTGRRPDSLQQALMLVFLAIAVALPFIIHSARWTTLLTIVVIYVVLASGLNIVVGFTGLLDLGYVAFFAIGGYYTAIIFIKVLKMAFGVDIDDYWWLMWVNLLVGGLLAAGGGAILGLSHPSPAR